MTDAHPGAGHPAEPAYPTPFTVRVTGPSVSRRLQLWRGDRLVTEASPGLAGAALLLLAYRVTGPGAASVAVGRLARAGTPPAVRFRRHRPFHRDRLTEVTATPVTDTWWVAHAAGAYDECTMRAGDLTETRPCLPTP